MLMGGRAPKKLIGATQGNITRLLAIGGHASNYGILIVSIFLSAEEIGTLTGKRRKSCQIAWLRKSGIPFYVNASGRPVVTRAAVEGQKNDSDKMQGVWRSAVSRVAG